MVWPCGGGRSCREVESDGDFVLYFDRIDADRTIGDSQRRRARSNRADGQLTDPIRRAGQVGRAIEQIRVDAIDESRKGDLPRR